MECIRADTAWGALCLAGVQGLGSLNYAGYAPELHILSEQVKAALVLVSAAH